MNGRNNNKMITSFYVSDSCIHHEQGSTLYVTVKSRPRVKIASEPARELSMILTQNLRRIVNRKNPRIHRLNLIRSGDLSVRKSHPGFATDSLLHSETSNTKQTETAFTLQVVKRFGRRLSSDPTRSN